MKVIKQADCSDWKYHTTCGQCASELEVEPDDVFHQHYAGDQRDPSYDTYYAYCAVCSYQLPIPDEVVSKALKHNIVVGKRSKSS